MVDLKVASMMKPLGFAIRIQIACACQNTIGVRSGGDVQIPSLSTIFSCVPTSDARLLSADCRRKCVTKLVSCARISFYNADYEGRHQAILRIHAMGSACERILGA